METEVTGYAGIMLVRPVNGAPHLQAMTRPVPGPHEVLVRVATVGMCRTDLLVSNGTIPVISDTILGHEFSGWIEQIGPGVFDCPDVGALVSGNPTFALDDGRDGFMGVDTNGALATWVVLPIERIHLADGLDPRQAAYLEPVTAAMGGIESARNAGGKGAIVGNNRIASLTSSVMNRLDNPIEHDLITLDELNAMPDCSYEWLLEARLSDDLIATAIRKLKVGGTLILKSRHLDTVSIPARDLVLKRITLAGCTRSGFPEAMAWIHANPDIVADLLGESFPLEQWDKAFQAAETGEGRKIFVTIAENA